MNEKTKAIVSEVVKVSRIQELHLLSQPNNTVLLELKAVIDGDSYDAAVARAEAKERTK